MAKGSLGFILDGNYKAQYIGENAEFELLGEDIVEFLRIVVGTRSVDMLKQALSKVEMVDSLVDFPTEKQIHRYAEFYQGNINNTKKVDWYTLLAKLQNADWFVKAIDGKVSHIVNGVDFGNEYQHCEYAYIINLDTQTFDVYLGLDKVKGDYPFDQEEFGCRLMYKFPLSNIPQSWVVVIDEIVRTGTKWGTLEKQ